MEYKRVHPYEILARFKFLIFLLLPVLIHRTFIDFKNIFSILSTSVLNLALLCMFSVYVICEYKNKLWSFSDTKFFIKTGIINKSRYYVRNVDIHSTTLYRSLIMLLFGVYSLDINPSDRGRKTLNNLYLSKKSYKRVIDKIFNNTDYKFEYSPSIIKIFIMCLSWSNPATGVFIVIPLIKKSVKILGIELSKKIYSSVDVSQGLIEAGIPPITSSIIIITLIVMIVTITTEFFRYSRFSFFIGEKTVCIKRGMISRFHKKIKKKSISSVSVQQTLLMKIFKVYGVYVHSIRDAKQKIEKDFVSIYSESKGTDFLVSKIIECNYKNLYTIRPDSKSIKSFLVFPAVSGVILFIISFIRLDGIYNELFKTLLIILWIYLIWWIVVKIYAYKASKLSLYSDVLTVGGYRKFSLIDAYIPIEKIQHIVIRQNPIQGISNRCNVYIYPYYNYKEYFVVKHLKYSDVENFVETLENLYINN